MGFRLTKSISNEDTPDWIDDSKDCCEEEIQGVQRYEAPSSTTGFSATIGEWADNRNDSGKIFLGKISNETEVPSSPMSSGRTGAQEHLLAHGR